MGKSTFQSVGSKDGVLRSSSPVGELRKLIEEAQRANSKWATETMRDIRSDPQFRLVDCILVNEQGRVKGMWPTFTSYLNFPETKPPPTTEELSNMMVGENGLLYPLHSVRYVQVYCRRASAPSIVSIAGDTEVYPYGAVPSIGFVRSAEFNILYVPDDKLTPSETRKKGFALGSLGLRAISEFFVSGGDPEKIVAYSPRVYFGHGAHPSREEIYITSNPRSLTIATGHIPMDRRADKGESMLRIEMDPSGGDIIEGIFRGYEGSEAGNVPLVLRYRPHAPWAGFSPKHGGDENPRYNL